jgi:peptide/nickel transport system permease protein
MIRLLFKRLLLSVPILVVVTFISFAIMKLAPGDPVSMYMDPSVSQQDINQIRENLGFDQPISVQYFLWLKTVLKGDFGYSFVSKQPVLEVILDRLPASLLLSVSSLIIILCITVPLGILTAYKKNSFFDDFVAFFSFLGLSIPAFWLGLMLMLLFSLKLNILPSSGYLDPLLLDEAFYLQAIDIANHMILPLITIVVGGIAGLIRFNRFGLIKILTQDYIMAARARGISETKILFKHAFKNALLPIITLLGLELPGLIGGSFVIEYIFAWPGMGQLGVSAVFSRDYPVLMATVLFSSCLIIVGNSLADIAYTYADPRIRKK